MRARNLIYAMDTIQQLAGRRVWVSPVQTNNLDECLALPDRGFFTVTQNPNVPLRAPARFADLGACEYIMLVENANGGERVVVAPIVGTVANAAQMQHPPFPAWMNQAKYYNQSVFWNKNDERVLVVDRVAVMGLLMQAGAQVLTHSTTGAAYIMKGHVVNFPAVAN